MLDAEEYGLSVFDGFNDSITGLAFFSKREFGHTVIDWHKLAILTGVIYSEEVLHPLATLYCKRIDGETIEAYHQKLTIGDVYMEKPAADRLTFWLLYWIITNDLIKEQVIENL